LGGLIADAGQLVRHRSEPSEVFSFPLGLTLSIAPAWPRCLGYFGTSLEIEPSRGQLSGNAVLFPFTNTARASGSCKHWLRPSNRPGARPH
jgi:hypothetical protein